MWIIFLSAMSPKEFDASPLWVKLVYCAAALAALGCGVFALWVALAPI